jgi:hypothetical protein
MAHLHFRRTVYKSGGRKASGRVSYVTREPVRKENVAERQLRYVSRADREDLVFTHSRNLPAWAKGDPHSYFRAAEQYERAPNAEKSADKKDYRGVAFEEWKITLPHELTKSQNMDLMRDLVRMIAGDTLPITYAFHCPSTLDGTQAQPHLHLLISPRQDDGILRTPETHFKRYNRAHPERGGAQKARGFSRSQEVKQWRVSISDVVNLHLERAGIAERVHPDSLRDRGIDREPEPKLLPSESRTFKEERKVSTTMQEVLDVRAQRQQTRPKEQLNARQYWEHRKAELGLTRDMDLPAQLAIVADARAQRREQAPRQAVVEGFVGVEMDDRALGDLAGEAVRQAEHHAQDVWSDVHNEAERRVLGRLGHQAAKDLRTAAQGMWQDVQDRTQLRALGDEALEDAWRDAALLWAEETGARALHDLGWEEVQAAREQGAVALAVAVQAYDAAHQAYLARQQTRAWEGMVDDLQALRQRLDTLSGDDGAGSRVRVQLWDKEHERGMGF